ncbi:MAG: hypothetical protein HGA96_09610 [Desulfobulbaceae bacterium]|nr:hypothetical protein [Desulfobulbaceae bacterium]
MRKIMFNRRLCISVSQLSAYKRIYLPIVSMFVVIVLVFALHALSFAGTQESGGFMDNIKSIWYYVYPPKDYSNLLVDEEIDISRIGAIYRYQFTNKYKGNHSAGIFLKGFSKGGLFSEEYLKNNKFTLMVNIDFYVDKKLTISKIFEGLWYPFVCEKVGGLIFMFYKTPNDLPINKLISCEVKIIAPDKNLSDTYGPARFYIGKESDQ